MLADAASPVALFTIGAVLSRAGRHAHTPLSLYLPVALRKLLLHPLLVFLVAGAAVTLGSPLTGMQVMLITLTATALPSASNVAMLAERWRRQRPHRTHHHEQHRAGLRQLLAAGLGLRRSTQGLRARDAMGTSFCL